MATPAPSYASPQTSSQIRKSERLADMIAQLGQRPQSQYNTAVGTIGSVLSDAILNHGREQADRRAERMLEADRTGLADLIIGGFKSKEAAAPAQFPGATPPVQAMPQTMPTPDLSGPMPPQVQTAPPVMQPQQAPKGPRTGPQATPQEIALVESLLKNPATFEQGQQLALQIQARAATPLEPTKPVIASAGSRGFTDDDQDGSWEEVFNVPDPSASASGSKVHAGYINPEGRVVALMQDGSEKVTNIKVQDLLRQVDAGGVPINVSPRTGAASPVTVGAPGAPSGGATGQPVTAETVGQNQAAIKDITTAAAAKTEAKLNLPDAINSAQNAIGVIDGMLAQPGFDSRYGMGSVGGLMPPLKPGGEGANAQAYIDQVKGQAFLQGIKALAGTGPVANKEGQAATQAYTRLQSQGMSPAEARKAAGEMRAAAENLVIIGKVKAGLPIDYSQLSERQLELIATMEDQ